MSMCPFMSTDMSAFDPKNPKKVSEKAVPCVQSCALYYKGHCSINIIAQTQYREYTKKYPIEEKAHSADDHQQ